MLGAQRGKLSSSGKEEERVICTPNSPCPWKSSMLRVACGFCSVFTWSITLNKAEKHDFNSGNKSAGNPSVSAHEKVLFFKHTDVFK